jgi:hypothetical protein
MLGTIRINNYDKVLKGRSTKGYSGLKGEDSPGCKLNNLDVLEIRQLMNYPLSQREIGKYYGVADTTISAIKLQKYWKHIL